MHTKAAQATEAIDIRPRADAERHFETSDAERPFVIWCIGVIEHRFDRRRGEIHDNAVTTLREGKASISHHDCGLDPWRYCTVSSDRAERFT